MPFSYIWSPIFRIIDSSGSRPSDKGEGGGGGGGEIVMPQVAQVVNSHLLLLEVIASLWRNVGSFSYIRAHVIASWIL